MPGPRAWGRVGGGGSWHTSLTSYWPRHWLARLPAQPCQCSNGYPASAATSQCRPPDLNAARRCDRRPHVKVSGKLAHRSDNVLTGLPYQPDCTSRRVPALLLHNGRRCSSSVDSNRASASVEQAASAVTTTLLGAADCPAKKTGILLNCLPGTGSGFATTRYSTDCLAQKHYGEMVGLR